MTVKNWDNPQTMEETIKCIDKHDRNENKQTGKLSNRYETIRSIFYLTAEGYSCNHAEWVASKPSPQNPGEWRKGRGAPKLRYMCD